MDDVRPPINPYSAPAAPLAARFPATMPATASRWRRLGASLLDTLLVIFCVLPAGIASDLLDKTGDARDGLFGVVAFGLLLVLLIVDLILLARDGQTLGKRWLGIRIVRSDGSPAGLGRSFGIRYLLTAVLGIVPLFQLVDILFIFAADRRCIHDHMADTIVIDA